MEADTELGAIVGRAFPGARIQACTELEGGISARAMLVELVLSDSVNQCVVVRRPSGYEREQTRRIVQHEYQLLRLCAEHGIAAPKPLALDREAGALVLDYVDGAPYISPEITTAMLQQMAQQLARIHAVPLQGSFDFLPRCRQVAERRITTVPRELDSSLDEGRIRSALNGLWPWPEYNACVLLHGDYWPGNLLWRDGKLKCVLDWEEAATGDPLADLAIARLDTLWAFGEAAMHAFTEHYRQCTTIDWRLLPAWDLCMALRPMSRLGLWATSYPKAPLCRPDVTEQSMRAGHRRFVQLALAELGLSLGTPADLVR